MKRTLLSIILPCLALMAVAQPAGGFGGFQAPKVDLPTSQEWKDVNYAGDDKAFHTCDIYLPKKEAASYPVVIHIYGSAWFSNNGKGMADLGTIGKSLLEAGYAVVCPNHRSSMDAKWPAQIHDIRAVIRFVRGEAAKYKFDTSFIATSGFSSGGHLASTAATTSGLKQSKVGNYDIDLEGNLGNYLNESSAVNAACDWSGPVDLTNMDCGEGMKMGENSPEDVILNSKLDREPDKYRSLSATYYVDKNDPPVIIFHGDKDNVVPNCQGKEFYELLKAAGVKTVATFPAEGSHGGPQMYTEENLKKMVCFLDCVRKGEGCCKDGDKKDGCCAKDGCCGKQAAKTRIIEDGGTGPFKAIMKEEPTLKEHTVIVPQDLTPFGPQKQLPVLVWGNGACANSPFEHINFLNEIASNGYIVLATGNIPMTDEWYKGPMSRSEQQIESIDWIIAQNADPKSPYYQKIDVKNICVAGMSCGGLQTLYNCADPRITTLMICNSGLFKQSNASQAVGGMPMPEKSKLKDIHTPIIYILGGPTDIAYENGMDDFHLISHVPACAINYPVGHGGTYRQPHGGEFTIPALAWLNWQLKGDQEAAKMFIGKKPALLDRKDWTIEKNKPFQKLK
jgi:acetyl esterase/lipase